jgi:nicotinate-nucleotide pyrophosphorylase
MAVDAGNTEISMMLAIDETISLTPQTDYPKKSIQEPFKTNHLKVLRARSSPQSIVDSPQLIQRAIERAKRVRPKKFVEVEVTNLREFQAALKAKPNAILLDNWSLRDIRKAVALRNHGLQTMDYGLVLEASGGVTWDNVRRLAKTGVDRISVGRLTHSSPALDVSLQVL